MYIYIQHTIVQEIQQMLQTSPLFWLQWASQYKTLSMPLSAGQPSAFASANRTPSKLFSWTRNPCAVWIPFRFEVFWSAQAAQVKVLPCFDKDHILFLNAPVSLAWSATKPIGFKTNESVRAFHQTALPHYSTLQVSFATNDVFGKHILCARLLRS